MAFNTATANTPAASRSWLRPGPIISVILVVVLAVFFLSNYIKWGNYGASQENALTAQLDSNKNNMGQLTLKVKEAMKVAQVNNEDLNDIIRGAIEGRYGDEGTQNAMLWVKENYPGTYDPALYVNVQQAILAGRTDFEFKQNQLIEKVRIYKNATDFFWSGLWLKIAGYPRSTFNWDDYKPVVAGDTQQKFETKVDGGLIDTTLRERSPAPDPAPVAPTK